MQWRPRQGLPVQHALHGGGGGVPLRVQRQHEVHLERLLLPDVRPHQRPAPPPPPNLVKDPPRRLSKSKPFLRAQPAGEKQCRCLWPQLHKFHTGLNSEKCEVSQKCAKSPPCAVPPHCMCHLWRFVGRQADSTPPLRAKCPGGFPHQHGVLLPCPCMHAGRLDRGRCPRCASPARKGRGSCTPRCSSSRRIRRLAAPVQERAEVIAATQPHSE